MDHRTVKWRKSSRSGGNSGQCVELADLEAEIGVRDSKDPDGPILTFTRREFTAFAAQIKASLSSQA